jgi:hypothetical protein
MSRHHKQKATESKLHAETVELLILILATVLAEGFALPVVKACVSSYAPAAVVQMVDSNG